MNIDDMTVSQLKSVFGITISLPNANKVFTNHTELKNLDLHIYTENYIVKLGNDTVKHTKTINLVKYNPIPH